MLYRRGLRFAAYLAATLWALSGPAASDQETEFRRLCQMDTSPEKCDCYLGSLQEWLTDQDYRVYLGAMMDNAQDLDRGIELAPHLNSIASDSPDLHARIIQASDHGLTICSIDFHE